MFNREDTQGLSRLLPLCEKHFKAAGMDKRGYSYEYMSAKNTLEAWLQQPCIYIISHTDTLGDCDGIIAFAKMHSPFNTQDVYFSELLWYATTPKIMKTIFEHFMARYVFLEPVRIGIPVKASLSRFLKRRGFTLTEMSYLGHNK